MLTDTAAGAPAANVQAELDAIRTGAAVFPLTDRAFLRISGPDAPRWLNGMVTNAVQKLAPGEGCYNFLLNAQGRIQGDCTIYREHGWPTKGDPSFLLETDASQIYGIEQLLDRFIIMDDVVLSRALVLHGETISAGRLEGLGLSGKEASALLTKVMPEMFHEFLLVDAPQPSSFVLGTHAGKTPAFVLTPPGTVETHEVWSASPDLDDARSEFKKLGAVEVSAEAIEALRILEARPKFGVDIRDRDLPQETNQTHALSFNKGCYLGQEIVERIHARGQVHRLFTQFELTGSLPALPCELTANGKAAGELTSAAAIDGRIVALGYARREVLDLKQSITYPGGVATPVQPARTNI